MILGKARTEVMRVPLAPLVLPVQDMAPFACVTELYFVKDSTGCLLQPFHEDWDGSDIVWAMFEGTLQAPTHTCLRCGNVVWDASAQRRGPVSWPVPALRNPWGLLSIPPFSCRYPWERSLCLPRIRTLMGTRRNMCSLKLQRVRGDLKAHGSRTGGTPCACRCVQVFRRRSSMTVRLRRPWTRSASLL